MSEEKDQWLIGKLEKELFDTPLPKNVQILKCYYHKRYIENKNVSSASEILANHVHQECERMGLIPMKTRNIKRKIKRLIEQYEVLKRNHASKKSWHAEKVKQFETVLGHTFKGFSDEKYVHEAEISADTSTSM